eukprot:TRINITY_DN16962_c0_g1_i1.p2 TRINITY_DN16962_c0_g1~~TRINITY_DN16962_c0_g1_i1.p2  ORF type:complete len:220 (+),score=15.95 TRINITY_DN16962_c0_g1_i1:272-931(+)
MGLTWVIKYAELNFPESARTTSDGAGSGITLYKTGKEVGRAGAGLTLFKEAEAAIGNGAEAGTVTSLTDQGHGPPRLHEGDHWVATLTELVPTAPTTAAATTATTVVSVEGVRSHGITPTPTPAPAGLPAGLSLLLTEDLLVVVGDSLVVVVGDSLVVGDPLVAVLGSAPHHIPHAPRLFRNRLRTTVARTSHLRTLRSSERWFIELRGERGAKLQPNI